MRNKKFSLQMILVPVILALSTIFACSFLARSAMERAEDSAYLVLSGSAEEQASTLQTFMDGRFDTLEAYSADIANALGGAGAALQSEEMLARLSAIEDASAFREVFVADLSGTAYAVDGSTFRISDREYFSFVSTGSRDIEWVSRARNGDGPRFILAIPLLRNHSVVGLLAGTMDEPSLRDLLDSRVFDPEGFSFVCDGVGNIIIGAESGRESMQPAGNSLIKILERNDNPVVRLQVDLANKTPRQMTYTQGGIPYYAVYRPTGISDWMLFNAVPAYAVKEDTGEATRISVSVMLIVVLLCGLMILYVFFLDRRRRKAIELEREDLKAAALQSGWDMLKYDARTDTARSVGNPPWFFHGRAEIRDFSKSLLAGDQVAPESRETLTALFRSIQAGQPSYTCDLQIRYQDGTFIWIRVNCMMVQAGGDTPHALISFYDNTEQRERELAYDKWKTDLSLLTASCLLFMEVNLTMDVIERMEGPALYYPNLVPGVSAFSALLGEDQVRYIHPDDLEDYLRFISAQRLLALYAKGSLSDAMALRSSVTGEEQWYRVEIRMTRYPHSGNVQAFFLLSDANAEQREKSSLMAMAQQDPLTGTLNRKALELRIRESLAHAGEENLAVLFLVDLDNLKQINDARGHQAGDTALRSIADAISRAFRSSDVVGRLGGDEFMAFLPSCASEGAALQKAAALVEATQFNLEDLVISASVGVAVCRGREKTFDELYREADVALYEAKTSGKSQYRISGGAAPALLMEEHRQAQASSIQFQTLMEHMDGGIILASVGEEITVTYVSPSFYRSMGRTEQECSSEDLLSLVDPAHLPLVEGAIRRAAESGESTDCVYRVIGAEGTWRHARIARLPASGGDGQTVIGVVSDISDIKRTERRLQEADARYRVAAELVGAYVFEVDIATHTLYQSEEAAGDFGLDAAAVPNVPESLLDAGWVHPDSTAEFRAMYDDIYHGREDREYALLLRSKGGRFNWFKARIGFVRDAEGLPRRAIGVTDPVSNVDFEMHAFHEELRFMKLIRPSLLGTIRANLSKDSLELCDLPLDVPAPVTYTGLYGLLKDIVADGSDLSALSQAMERSCVIGQYRSGESWRLAEFRRLLLGGAPRWTSLTVRLSRHPVSGDVYLFGYLRDINVLKQWELMLAEPVSRSNASFLYTPQDLASLSFPALDMMPPGAACALTVYAVEGANRLRVKQGQAAVSSALQTLSRLFRIVISGDAAVCQLDETHFAVLHTNLTQPHKFRAAVEQVRAQLLSMLQQTTGGQEIDLSCGYVTAGKEEADFERMLHQAVIACDSAEQTPGSRIAQYAPANSLSAAENTPRRRNGEKLRLLIADDDEVSRLLLNRILEPLYDVELVRNGAETLDVLHARSDCELVFLDIEMPVKNGWEVLEEIRSDRRLADIPVVIVTADHSPDTEVKALNLGAMDVLRKPYEPEILISRLNNIIRARESSRMLEQSRLYEIRYQQQSHSLWMAEHDELTGLLNRQALYARIQKCLAETPERRCNLLLWDLDNFKVFNDVLGVEAGDHLLRDIGAMMRAVCGAGAPYGRIEADRFAVLLPSGESAPEELFQKVSQWLQDYPVDFRLVGRMGVYAVDDPALNPGIMYDRALLALRSIKGNFSQRIAWYDESLRSALLAEQELFTEMVPALEKGQFKVWFQPQFNYESGAIIGAEALVRWEHPTKGILSPGVFIPLFEHNGFISRLDEYVWEQSCIYLSRWRSKAAELPQVGISVNISRMDIYDPHLCDRLVGLVNKYDIPISTLKLEITESAYMQDPEQLIHVVEQLQAMGFTIEMDDFGAGYSSLNTLKDVPVDILKLDIRFLSQGRNDSRGGNILSSVLRMAHWLKLPVIAEGVETKSQADYLKSLNCEYMQGYFFARPMPAEEFEQLLLQSRIGRTDRYAKVDLQGMAEFWDPSAQTALLFNSFVGGAAIAEYREGTLELLRANDRFFREMRVTREAALTGPGNLLENLDHRDRAILRQMLDEAIHTQDEGTCEVAIRRANAKAPVWARIRARLLACNVNSYLVYLSVENVTEHRNLELHNRKQSDEIRGALLAARAENERNRLVLKYMNALILYYDYNTDLLSYQVQQQQGEVSRRVERYLATVLNQSVVHPDDRVRYRDIFLQARKAPVSGTFECLADPFGAGYHWVRGHYTSVADETGRVFRLVGLVYDIQAEKEQQALLASLREQLGGRSAAPVYSDVLVERVFTYLYGSEDMRSTVRSILEIMGTKYGASRAYVYEDSPDHRFCSNTFEWCAEQTQPQIERMQVIPYEGETKDYPGNFNEEGIFFCPDVSLLPEALRKRLSAIGVKAVLQSALLSGGVFSGFIGFDDCSGRCVWTTEEINTLALVAKLVGAFLLKERSAEQARLSDNFRTALDKSASFVYVVEPESREIVYDNLAIRRHSGASHVGERCYEAFMGLSAPCPGCPLSLPEEEKTRPVEILRPDGMRLLVQAAPLHINGQDMLMVTSMDMNRRLRREPPSEQETPGS